MGRERTARVLLLILVCVIMACATRRGPVSPALEKTAQQEDALATSDALEALIEVEAERPEDRAYAFDEVRAHEEDGAAYAFARAAITGRLVQQHGLTRVDLVGEVERWALRSSELDPDFRDGAAQRLLGTLYVLAPATLVEHGDSERGLELLEDVTREHPRAMENHLRLAEAYVALGDPGPAEPHLCACIAARSSLRRDDQKLLDALVSIAGAPSCAAER